MSRRILLHIGTEKTGSTAIQSALAAARPLLPAHGFALPESPGLPAHQMLAVHAADPERLGGLWHLVPEGRLEEARARFAEAFAAEMAALPASVHSVILTSEHLHSRVTSEAAIARLAALLAPHAARIEVLCWLRRQDRLAVSAYSTALRNGAAGRAMFPTHPAQLERYFDYDALTRRWAAVFGEDAIRLRIHGPGEPAEADAARDAFDAFGLPAALLPPAPERLNRASRAEDLVLLRAANEAMERLALARGLPPDAFAALRERLRRHVHAAPPGHGLRPSRAEAMAFLDRFREGNAAVCARHLPGRAALFDEDFSEYPEQAEPTAAQLAAALDLAAELLAEAFLAGRGR